MFGSSLHLTTCAGIMARAALYVLVLSFLLALRSSNADAGEILDAPETQYTPQGEEAEFFCQAEGGSVHWVINDDLILNQNQKDYEEQGFRFERLGRDDYDGYSRFNLSLAVAGTVANNNTKIECLSSSDTSSPSDSAFLIVMGRPSAVDPSLHYLNETVLSVDWSPPFTWEGYAVTEYEMKVRNTTVDKITYYEKLEPDDSTSDLTVMLTAPMGQAAHSCHELEVAVTAKTPLGSSDPSTLSVWFPIAPAPFSSPPIVEVLISKGTSLAMVKVSFVLPELCPSQLIDYSIVVRESATQDVVATIDHEDYRVSEGSDIEEDFTDLAMDKDYEATVSITGVTGGQVSKSGTSLDSTTGGVSSPDDEEGIDLYIIIGAAAGGAVLIVILMIVIIGILVASHKRNVRRRGHNGLTGGKKSMTNPIYEGPMYETICDISPASSPGEMPTVVRESPYFGNQIHPTYENGNTRPRPDMMNVPPPIASSCDDSYTVMSTAVPVAKKLNAEERPKPDVIRYVKTEC